MSLHKTVWGWVVTLVVFVAFLWGSTHLIMGLSYNAHLELIKDQARQALQQLQYVVPRLDPELLQEYVQQVYPGARSFRYMLIMDTQGKAVAHSDPERVGMRFFDPGLQRVIETGQPVEQIYTRDPDNPDSPFHGERIVDMIAPFYSTEGSIQGAVNVGLSLKSITALRTRYLLVTSACIAIWTAMMLTYAILRYRQLAARRKAELEKEKLKTLLHNIINSMPSSLVAADARGKVVEWNCRAEEATGVPRLQAINRPLEEVYPDLAPELPNISTVVRERKPYVHSGVTLGRKNDARLEDVVLYPLVANGVDGVVIRIDDVTDRVRLEQLMVQSEKMMSVGGLAAGMAHEINNPLAAIIGYTYNMKRRIFSDLTKNTKTAEDCSVSLEAMRDYLRRREIPQMLEGISESVERASKIINNMLGFSRKSEKRYEMCNITELIEKSVELVSSDYDLKKRYDFRQIQLIREYEPDTPLVFCEPNEMQQVFLNILKNGAEAMAEKNYENDSSRFILRVKRANDSVVVEIEDNGPGINEKIKRRVFEPFFTTKPVGRGTGLGLSVSYFIVTDQHGGRMNVDSSLGKWTRFTIQLPLERDGAVDGA